MYVPTLGCRADLPSGQSRLGQQSIHLRIGDRLIELQPYLES